ncbi:UNVERIFIED_CONTAM: ABC transporter C family member 10 [Sesamum angustifolium]|uniref:ABC transporter C family member 10 n=1 Tax=Sesamum angustifolium TaxID=2727405 RepID=A0AAW2Q934_9LAMI
MDVNLQLVDVAFCLLFVVWLLWDFLKERGDFGGDNHLLLRGKPSLFSKITVVLNFIISISYVGFCLHEFWVGTALIEAVFSTIAWCCACVVAVYAVSQGAENWPLVLVLWWGFSSTCDLLVVVFYILHRFESVEVPKFLSKVNIIDFLSLPLSVLLCFSALRKNTAKKMSDTTKPLLENQLENDLEHDSDPFSSAGIWSKLTFRWLNPLFEKGRHEKLQLGDIPPIPRSETADEAASLLEDSLRKQKTQVTSLPNAILDAIWTPLAIMQFLQVFFFMSNQM